MAMKDWPRTYQELWGALAVMIMTLSSASCTMIGPDYVRPPAPTAADWIETNEPNVKRTLRDPASRSAAYPWEATDNPDPPAEVAVGIPADLLRRRPDLRQAERELAAQSAQIGIAKADLLPSFALLGSVSLSAEKFGDLFTSNSFENFGGPSFRWAILNYGRIRNNVRVQDARFQALIGDYENTVLRAQEEVESAIAGYLGVQRQVAFLTGSVASATRAVELADFQYREGAVDYTRVLTSQQFLVGEQDRLVTTKGSVAVNLASLYRALGGGWELRAGSDFVSDGVKAQMRERTNWGDMLSTEDQVEDIGAASSGTEGDQGWWRWRTWTPKW